MQVPTEVSVDESQQIVERVDLDALEAARLINLTSGALVTQVISAAALGVAGAGPDGAGLVRRRRATRDRGLGRVSRVVDVGGGLGAMLAILLRRHRHLLGLLYDQANALQGAAAFLEAAGVAHRVEVRTGNFFESVPAGADL